MQPYQKTPSSHQSSISQQSTTNYAALLPFIFQEQFMYFPLFPVTQKESEDTSQTNLEVTVVLSKGCNCKKSQCLKQYCDCFAEGKECSKECQCYGCHNQLEFREVRDKAMLQILKRDPKAFTQKIEEVQAKKIHNRGCNCKKSGCQKKYCECFQAGVPCQGLCKCTGCQNDHTDHLKDFNHKKTCVYI